MKSLGHERCHVHTAKKTKQYCYLLSLTSVYDPCHSQMFGGTSPPLKYLNFTPYTTMHKLHEKHRKCMKKLYCIFKMHNFHAKEMKVLVFYIKYIGICLNTKKREKIITFIWKYLGSRKPYFQKFSNITRILYLIKVLIYKYRKYNDLFFL